MERQCECEGCCQGFSDEDLVGGLCPSCREVVREPRLDMGIPIEQELYRSLVKRGMEHRMRGKALPVRTLSLNDLTMASEFGIRVAQDIARQADKFLQSPETFWDEIISLVYDRDEALEALRAASVDADITNRDDAWRRQALEVLSAWAGSLIQADLRFDQHPLPDIREELTGEPTPAAREDIARKIAEQLSRELPGMVHPPQQHEAWWYFKHLEQ
jgi:hypothetical protein